MEVLNQIQHAVLCGNINAGGRLVEQEYLWLLSQRSGDQHSLLLAPRQMSEGRVPMVLHPYIL